MNSILKFLLVKPVPKEVKRVTLLITILIIAWSIKAFLTEETTERALESIALFVGLIALLLLIAFSIILFLAITRKILDKTFK